MNVLSDSDSSDSEKIRYKTESTRYKIKMNKLQPDVRERHEEDMIAPTSICSSKREIRSKDYVPKSSGSSEKGNRKYKDKTEKCKDKADKYANRNSSHVRSSRSDRHEKHVRSSSLHKKSRYKDIDQGEKSIKNKQSTLDITDAHSNNKANYGNHECTQSESQQRQQMTNDILFCGPSLPPHMQKPKEDIDSEHKVSLATTRRTYGPNLPNIHRSKYENSQLLDDDDDDDDDRQISNVANCENEDEILIGPVLENNSYQNEVHLKLEKRAIELKLSKLNENEEKDEHQKREEWMVSLPELRTVSDLKITARHFKTKEHEEIKDRSLWTETPRDREENIRQGELTYDKMNREKIDKIKRERRDAEQEDVVRKHKKKHKRDESLLKIHQKNMKKHTEKKSFPVERRPFTRDMDLKSSSLFNDKMKKSILEKAQLLNTRFKSGQSKFL